ncbi:MAG: hypothetical protein A3J97_11365 [Spirochaetes bacterium RIFOXYC1_FULL_54_7]|nr:MAG: hypothetical protein A3J97_11365 [Spirochaetes bacterium RIFOXYC1_FULL_54_7]
MSIRWASRVQAIADIGTARNNGFLDVQLPVEAIMELGDLDFEGFRKDSTALGTIFEVFEAPLPKGVQITEQGFNTYHWTEYLGAALKRLSILGCRTLVWGDGRSRLLPVEGDVSTAKEHFYQFMFLLCGMAENFGIEVCLEPLGPRRTNFINSLDEMKECVSLIDRSNLSMLISPRDLHETGTGMTMLQDAGNRIRHVHVENPTSPEASIPPDPSDGQDYLSFFNILRRLDYSGVISLSYGATAASLAYCRTLWEAAGSSL